MSKIERPHSHPLDFIRRAVAVLREQRVAVEHADAAAVVLGFRERVAESTEKPLMRRRVSLADSELYLASATLPMV